MSDSMIRSIDARTREVFGVLARSVPSRLVEISRSGCLLESGHRVENGTIGELRLLVGGELLVDDVRVTRCVRVEGSGSSYLVGAEFLQTRYPGERSIRRAVIGILRGLTHSERMLHPKPSKTGRKAEEGTAGPMVNTVSTGEGVMKDLFARLVQEEEGQDLIEYGLLAGIITALAVTAITNIGPKVQDYITDLDGMLPAAD